MKKELVFLPLITIILLLGCEKQVINETELSDAKTEVEQSLKSASVIFENELPSIDGGSYYDPWVIYVNGYYYYLGSDGGRLWITKSGTLQDILMQPKTYIFTPPAGTMYSRNLWAPELHYLSGRWYAYFAANDGNNDNHRNHVLEGGTNANDPLNGTFNYKATLTPSTDRWGIDASPFMYSGQLYIVWSGWPGTTNTTQRIYVARMSNPYTISGDRYEISSPTYSWEKVGFPTVNEGPQVLISGNSVHVIYSASGSWTNDYCLGRLTCTNGNLTSKSSWTKTGPVFSKFGNVNGPGHASFVKSPDGIQWWIVYHAANYSGSGWDRRIMTQQFAWNGDVPFFGYPIEKGIPIPSPSIGTSYSMPIANGTYKIKSVATGQCLDVPGRTSVPGTQIHQWTENGDIAQEWIFTSQGDGYYKIQAACNNLCLDNAGGSLNAGNIMIQWNDIGGNPQRWRVQDMGNGSFKIINKQSLLALNVPNSSTVPGTKIEQWWENQYDAELWQIIPQ